MAVPNDPVILMSYLNTQLRDHYISLEDLCKTMDLNQAEITAKLNTIGYVYNAQRNQFVPA
ncbi:DUF4250 domain-containing protein [Ruminococcus sp.]|uniref:DUF4250 domain-containing protein n=1 Tax=Ruminococcus sp. TaxID=41978 RepID=UPI0025FE0965|nr:DUF4250 domain-containing protein [Ruminococcus sp.]